MLTLKVVKLNSKKKSDDHQAGNIVFFLLSINVIEMYQFNSTI